MSNNHSQTPSPPLNNRPDSESIIEIYLPKDSDLKRWGLISLGGIILFLVTLFSILLILNTYTAIQRHGRAALLNNVLPLFPLLFIGLPLGISIILWAKNHWRDRLILQNEEIIQRKGKKHKVWSFNQTQRLDTAITNINFGGSIVGTKVKLLLEDGDQKQWVIRNDYENMADLIESIRSRILPELYRKSLKKMAVGEEVTFRHDLIANKNGLVVKDQHIPWDEISDPIIKNSNLNLANQENKEIIFKSKTGKIKNLDLFQCLLENRPDFEN